MPDLTKQDLKEAFAEALKQHSRSSSGFGGGGAGGSGGGTGGGGGSTFDQVLTGVKDQFAGLAKFGIGATTDTFAHLSKGGMRVSEAFNIVGDNARGAGFLFGDTIGKFSGLLAKGSQFYEENLDAFRLLSKGGMNFNNSLVDLGMAAAGTRLGMREFTELMQTNNKAFATLPGGVAQGAKEFTKASQAMFDDSGLVDRMTGLGFTTEDLNSLLSTTITQQRRQGLNEADSRKVAIEQVEKLGKEMDLMAKLTGNSRKEQEDLMRKQQENGQVQAALADEIARGGKNVQQGFNAMQTAAQQGGTDFQMLSEQIFAMGRPTEDMIGKFNAIGPAAQKALYEAAEAAKKGDDVRARELTERAAALAALQQQSNTNRQLARQGEKDFVDMQTQTRGFSTQLQEIAKANKLNLQTEEGLSKALELRRQGAKIEQEKSDGATKALTGIENATKDASAGIRQGILQQVAPASPLGRALNEFYQNLDAAKGKSNNIREETQKATDAAFSKLIGTIADTSPKLKDKMKAVEEGLKLSKEQGTGLTGKSPELIAFITSLDKNAKLNETIMKEAKERGISQEQVIKEMVAKGPQALDKIVIESLKAKEADVQKERERMNKPEWQRRRDDRIEQRTQSEEGGGIMNQIQSITGVQTIGVDQLNILKGVTGLGTREFGTFGKTGKPAEPEDLLAFIHKGERVLNPKETEAFNSLGSKLSNLSMPMSDKFSSSVSSLIPKAQQTLEQGVPSAMEQITKGGPSVSLNDVVDRLERLNTTMTTLVDVQVDIGGKQIRATKSSGSGNVYERT
jgi:hypothetical protein